MDRYARLPFIILGSWLMVVCCASTSFADFVWLPPPDPYLLRYPHGLVLTLLTAFVVTIIVKYPVIYQMLGRPIQARLKLFLCVASINLITNPALQSAFLSIDPALITSLNSPWPLIFPIEFLVVVVEFGLFLWAFRWLYRRGVLTESISLKRTFVISLTVNLASFGLGFVGFTAVETAIFGFKVIGRGW